VTAPRRLAQPFTCACRVALAIDRELVGKAEAAAVVGRVRALADPHDCGAAAIEVGVDIGLRRRRGQRRDEQQQHVAGARPREPSTRDHFIAPFMGLRIGSSSVGCVKNRRRSARSILAPRRQGINDRAAGVRAPRRQPDGTLRMPGWRSSSCGKCRIMVTWPLACAADHAGLALVARVPREPVPQPQLLVFELGRGGGNHRHPIVGAAGRVMHEGRSDTQESLLCKSHPARRARSVRHTIETDSGACPNDSVRVMAHGIQADQRREQAPVRRRDRRAGQPRLPREGVCCPLTSTLISTRPPSYSLRESAPSCGCESCASVQPPPSALKRLAVATKRSRVAPDRPSRAL